MKKEGGIGDHAVIRHAYNTSLTACARLHSYSTGARPRVTSALLERQDMLAADDLILFAVHARRLLETTVGTRIGNKVFVKGVDHQRSVAHISFSRIINVLVHHREITILRTTHKQRMGSYESYLEENQITEPASCILTSDEGKTLGFRIHDLVDAYEHQILEAVIELCGENKLDLTEQAYPYD